MLSPSALIKSEDRWGFSTEENLEDFVWSNLDALLGLTPLKRQLGVKGEYCDILAIDNDKQLTIIELKNTEDRYIVQQLTRYFDNLLDEKPLGDQIDYSNPIRLIAIAPSFHRHNFIDQKYSKLQVEFLTFSLETVEDSLSFEIFRQNDEILSKIKIPNTESLLIEDTEESLDIIVIPKPPKSLVKILDEQLPDQKANILEIRNKILSFSKHIGEVTTKVTQRYGIRKSESDIYKSKLCAEFYSEFFKGKFNGFRISLWLPYANERYIRRGKYEKVIVKALISAEFHKYGFSQDTQVRRLGICRNPRPVAAASRWIEPERYAKILEKTTGKILKDYSLGFLIDLALEECLANSDEDK